jgi:glycerol uptake facilitator protein
MAGVFTALRCGGEANLNPAVTLGLRCARNPQQAHAFLFVCNYLAESPVRYSSGCNIFPLARNAGCFRETRLFALFRDPQFFLNLLSEIIATFVLIFVIGAIYSRLVFANGPAPGFLAVYLVSSLVWGVGLSLGGSTGYAINPARDLGPRIAHAILPISGKGGSDWSYAPVPIIGPLVGGALAGLSLRLSIFEISFEFEMNPARSILLAASQNAWLRDHAARHTRAPRRPRLGPEKNSATRQCRAAFERKY